MKIGFIGLGIMGEAMCLNIIRKHDDQVYVYDTVADKMQPLVEAGALGCPDAMTLAGCSDLIISMVPRSEHARAVYQGILPELKPGQCCIDMSTIDPAVSVEIAGQVKAKGAQFADAPVVKSRPAAEAGTLGILVGCDEPLYEQILPILKYMGQNVIRMGGNGTGLVMKICHNALAVQIQNGVNETLSLAMKNGISIPDFAEAVSYGGAQNFYLDGQAPKLAAKDYTTAFSIANAAKDVGICLDMAERLKMPMPGVEVAAEVYQEAIQKDMSQEDWRATFKIVRDRA